MAKIISQIRNIAVISVVAVITVYLVPTQREPRPDSVEIPICDQSLTAFNQINESKPSATVIIGQADVESIENLALKNGFEVVSHFTDSRNYFVDSLWIRK